MNMFTERPSGKPVSNQLEEGTGKSELAPKKKGSRGQASLEVNTQESDAIDDAALRATQYWAKYLETVDKAPASKLYRFARFANVLSALVVLAGAVFGMLSIDGPEKFIVVAECLVFAVILLCFETRRYFGERLIAHFAFIRIPNIRILFCGFLGLLSFCNHNILGVVGGLLMMINAGVQCYVYAHRPDTYHAQQTPTRVKGPTTPAPTVANSKSNVTPATKADHASVESDDGKKLSRGLRSNNTTLDTPSMVDTSVASI